MSQLKPHDSITPTLNEFGEFLRTIDKKSLSEILSYADQEATAAWRSAYHLKMKGKSGESAGQYAGILEELAAFLKAAVVYRPVNVPDEVFNQFLELRQDRH